MSTQLAVFPPNGQSNGRTIQIPKQLRRAASLREQVFAFLDATDNQDFVKLYELLGRYLKEVPEAVRIELDKLEYGRNY